MLLCAGCHGVTWGRETYSIRLPHGSRTYIYSLNDKNVRCQWYQTQSANRANSIQRVRLAWEAQMDCHDSDTSVFSRMIATSQRLCMLAETINGGPASPLLLENRKLYLKVLKSYKNSNSWCSQWQAVAEPRRSCVVNWLHSFLANLTMIMQKIIKNL
jgi:hypothetical protein